MEADSVTSALQIQGAPWVVSEIADCTIRIYLKVVGENRQQSAGVV